MFFESISASEFKYFNFTPPIAYRLIYNFERDVRLKIVTAQFLVHEKKTFNENVQFPFLVKLEVPDTTELEALKSAVENALGHDVDLLCDRVLYVNLKKEMYEALRKVSGGTTMCFEIKLRHVVYFSATPRIKFILEAFNDVPAIAPPKSKKLKRQGVDAKTQKPKLQRQLAVYPETQPADPEMTEESGGMIGDFLASLREESN